VSTAHQVPSADRAVSDVQRITGELQAAIRNGVYPPGSAMPGKGALAAQYEVSTEDIHKALNVLRARMYLRRIEGQGMFVAQQLPPERAAPRQTAA
jgi:GntR family transcriptional regulator